MLKYFKLDFENLEKSIKKEKTIRVGKPFGLKEIRIAPGINKVPMWAPVLSKGFLKRIKKAVRSKSPLVKGISCHRVIPIPATTGVRVNRKELAAATRSPNMAYAKCVTA